MKRSYNSETKAAVLAALLTGQAASFVAKEYSIPESTVKDWGAKARSGELSAEYPSQKKEIGELLIEYLRANIEALRKQAEVFGEPDYLRKNSAENLAVLHGVMADKAVRLLEAMTKNAASNSATKG